MVIIVEMEEVTMLDAFAELQKYGKIHLEPQMQVTHSPASCILSQLTEDFHKIGKNQFKLNQQFDDFAEEVLELLHQEITTQSETIQRFNRQVAESEQTVINLVWGLIKLYDALEMIQHSIIASGDADWILQMERLSASTAKIMQNNGLQFIATDSGFNETYHEVVSSVHLADQAHKAIVSVEQNGYCYHGKVWRKAKVIVNIDRKETP